MNSTRRIIGLFLEVSRLLVFAFWMQALPGGWFLSSEGLALGLVFLFPQSVFVLLWALEKENPRFLSSPGPMVSLKWASAAAEAGAALVFAWRPFVNPLESLLQPEFYLAFLLGLLDIIIISILKGAKAPTEPQGRL